MTKKELEAKVRELEARIALLEARGGSANPSAVLSASMGAAEFGQ